MGNTIVSLGTDRIVQGQRIRAEAKDIRVLFENRKSELVGLLQVIFIFD